LERSAAIELAVDPLTVFEPRVQRQPQGTPAGGSAAAPAGAPGAAALEIHNHFLAALGRDFAHIIKKLDEFHYSDSDEGEVIGSSCPRPATRRKMGDS